MKDGSVEDKEDKDSGRLFDVAGEDNVSDWMGNVRVRDGDPPIFQTGR